MKIIPGKSVGPFRIGMSLKDYETLLGPAIDRFKRTSDDLGCVVAYDSHNLHLTLNPTGAVDSITVFRPNTINLGDLQLLGRDFAEITGELAKTDWRFTPVDAGLWCPEAGVLLIESGDVVDGVEVLKPVRV
jgi:hypothetical protein